MRFGLVISYFIFHTSYLLDAALVGSPSDGLILGGGGGGVWALVDAAPDDDDIDSASGEGGGGGLCSRPGHQPE